jgi:hypothetical protein
MVDLPLAITPLKTLFCFSRLIWQTFKEVESIKLMYRIPYGRFSKTKPKAKRLTAATQQSDYKKPKKEAPCPCACKHRTGKSASNCALHLDESRLVWS